MEFRDSYRNVCYIKEDIDCQILGDPDGCERKILMGCADAGLKYIKPGGTNGRYSAQPSLRYEHIHGAIGVDGSCFASVVEELRRDWSAAAGGAGRKMRMAGRGPTRSSDLAALLKSAYTDIMAEA